NFAKRLGDFKQFVGKQEKNAPFDRVGEHKVIDLCSMHLPVAVNTSNALLHVHRIPWQVKVKQNPRELKVDAFAPRSGTAQHFWPILLPESTLSHQLCSMIPSAQHDHALSWIGCFYLPPEEFHRAKVSCKDHHFLMRIFSP